MRIRKCLKCGTYTLKESCSRCSENTVTVGPARYSPQDPYGKYRRQMKEQINDSTREGAESRIQQDNAESSMTDG